MHAQHLTYPYISRGWTESLAVTGAASWLTVLTFHPLLVCRLWRGAGLALPVFAARTHNSVGCGEFLDLLPLVEFADASGMRLIQV